MLKTLISESPSFHAVYFLIFLNAKYDGNLTNWHIMMDNKLEITINPTLDGGGHIVPPPSILCSGALIIDLRGPRFWYNSYFIVTMWVQNVQDLKGVPEKN